MQTLKVPLGQLGMVGQLGTQGNLGHYGMVAWCTFDIGLDKLEKTQVYAFTLITCVKIFKK